MERVDRELARMELEHVLDSRAFASSIRSRQLLRYLVDAEMAGRSQSLKGYTIAVEALGQPEDFDPSTSSLVRTQMRKLRELLDAYYQTEGRHAPVRFEAPKGGAYVRVVPNRNAKRLAFRALLTLFDGAVSANRHLFASWIYRASFLIVALQIAAPLMFIGSVGSYPVLTAAVLVSPIVYVPAALTVSYILTLMGGGRRMGVLEHAVAGAIMGLPYWLVILSVRWLGSWPAADAREAVLVLCGCMFACACVFGMAAHARDYRGE